MTHATRHDQVSLILLSILGACDPAAPSDASPPSATAPTVTASAESTAAAPPSSAEAEGANCYPAAKSRDYGSHATAAPPFGDCANNLKVHCGGEDGERGGLHGLPLDIAATTAARTRQPDACCYVPCD